ncbi:hypothetical protein [Sphingomonas sp. TX0522]|uniref:hypothetical protein n=1 Tax=Sphingomonas sp. TX0522 TaxID=2479205 RepID=UPI0018DF7098|nr:hypothetical protein [Sphingomonas sp. TX0522]MBI0532996.1 hypothetical protein [Sphingomonas sp. TX0522]
MVQKHVAARAVSGPQGHEQAPRRDWRVFVAVILAAIAVAAGMVLFSHLPEIYQKLVVLTMLGGCFGVFGCFVAIGFGRAGIGAISTLAALGSMSVVMIDGLTAAWLTTGVLGTAGAILIAIELSDRTPAA